jgi:cardiolipin synthase (CMP-forming)
LSLPNFITIGRIILVPIIVWFMLTGQRQAAFFAFMFAGLSDAADGYLAKRFKMETELGAYLDPLADKMLLVCIFVSLGVSGLIPSWLVIAIVTRDVLIVAAVVLSWLLNHPVHIKPLAVSKANTTAQIILAGFVLADEAFGLGLQNVRLVLIWTAGLLTVASMASYLSGWLRHMSKPPEVV